MYRKYYRRKRYYRPRRRYSSGPSPIEELAEGLFALLVALLIWIGKIIFKLIYNLFQSRNRPTFKINPIPLPIPSYVPPDNNYPINETEEKYSLKQSLLSPAEKDFREALEQVVGDRYKILPQVQLSRILIPNDSNKFDFYKIMAKSVDFVLFDQNDHPVEVIELDDSSHLRPDRMKRDIFVNQALKGAGLPILHIRWQPSYDLEDLNNKILSKLVTTPR